MLSHNHAIKIEEGYKWHLVAGRRVPYHGQAFKPILIVSNMQKLKDNIHISNNPYSVQQDSDVYIVEAYQYDKEYYCWALEKQFVQDICNNDDVIDIVSTQNIIMHSVHLTDFHVIEVYQKSIVLSCIYNRCLIYTKTISVGVYDIMKGIMDYTCLNYNEALEMLKHISFTGEYYDYKEKIIIHNIEITKAQIIDLLYESLCEILSMQFALNDLVIYSPYMHQLYHLIKYVYPKHQVYNIHIDFYHGINNYMKNFYIQKIKSIQKGNSLIDKIKFWLRINIW